ncbi:SDR family oxidoreductase [uncultured Desulfovibrio sp.]|uniref:SDR family NAD(P)-dependent oxidoreductase n=1 Tax=uncultured Desulfovibrio sp. TaxID=167968 RepID=UPI0026267F91|nr:SDR family oxidoreductase [uncultured Desulfovibrio sp.]
MQTFAGKTVFITGSRRGIGRALVKAFAEHGADIIAHARCESPEFEQDMADEAARCHVSIRPLYFDLGDTEAMKQSVKGLLKEMTPDVLVNNAATIQDGTFFLMTPIKTVQRMFEINLFAQMRLTQQILKPMLARQTGCIINMGSLAGLDMKPGMSAYGTSKAALIAWTQVLAAEVGTSGIRVNAIAPGLLDTDGGTLMTPKSREVMLAASAMHRLGTPEEIAGIAVFLASDAASFVNGEIIRADGGKL